MTFRRQEKTRKVTLVGQSHLRNPQAAENGFMLLSIDCMICIIQNKNKKLAGPPVYYSGSNEPSLAPQFRWLEYTFKAYICSEKMFLRNCKCPQKIYFANRKSANCK
jgi:hypothetical protein